jgi:hypothetical protein
VTEIEAFQARRTAKRPSGPAYWLITKNAFGRIEVLTLDYDGEEMLPVFSHREEAEMFLRLGSAGYDWRASGSGPRELVLILYGPCADVRDVALDPLPEMLADRSLGLVSLCRERFLQRLTWPEGDYSSAVYRSRGTRRA